jgi:hypothetical protein
VHNCQKRTVTKGSFWYIDRSDTPTEVPLPDLEGSAEKILKIAKQIKLQRQLSIFKCSSGDGCSKCRPLERIVKGEATFVGVNEFNHKDTYILIDTPEDLESSIL